MRAVMPLPRFPTQATGSAYFGAFPFVAATTLYGIALRALMFPSS